MFKALFSSTPNHNTGTTHNKSQRDYSDSKKARAWYFTAPNPNDGQKYATTAVPIAHNGSQQQLSIVVGRNGNVEVVTPQGQDPTKPAKHHIPNPGSLPNAVLVSPANQASHTKRNEKHPSAPPNTLRKVVSNDDRSKAVNNRHSIIGLQRVRSREYAQGPRSDVATSGGTIAPRTVSPEKARAQSPYHSHSQSHSHRHSYYESGDRDDSKKYPKSPHPSKVPLPNSRREGSPENYYHPSDRHVEGHHSSKHHSSSHHSHSHTTHHGHHHSSGKENVPSRTVHTARNSHLHLDNMLNRHSQAFLQAPSRSQPQPQPQPQPQHRHHSPSRPHSAEKHVRYLNPTHPEIIPDRTLLRPTTAQPYSTSAPTAVAPIAYDRPRRNSMPTQQPVYFGEPHSDPRLSHSYQNGYDIHTFRLPKPHGWFNRRGDQYVAKGVIKKQPLEMQWHPMFASYPEVGRGWMDEERKYLPPSGGILKN